jgi:hypothetical protein
LTGREEEWDEKERRRNIHLLLRDFFLLLCVSEELDIGLQVLHFLFFLLQIRFLEEGKANIQNEGRSETEER